MTKNNFAEHDVLHRLKHYLPAQAPLKDFIHHNTLHAFQDRKFGDALASASAIFGYKTLLSIDEYRELYHQNKIKPEALKRVINNRKGKEAGDVWIHRLLHEKPQMPIRPRIGVLRNLWKSRFKVDLDNLVHPLLFRLLCSYLDQGVAMWAFPVEHKGFLSSVRELEKNSYSSIFKTKRAKELLLHTHCKIDKLLDIVVGDITLYERYLFDQSWAHQGWSGIVSAIEDNPSTLLDPRHITLHDLIVLELLMEIDALDYALGTDWLPLRVASTGITDQLFDPVSFTEENEWQNLWQEAYEWGYYNEVLAALAYAKADTAVNKTPVFQAMFCIDDRGCSIRRHIELIEPGCETFGTPGFFGVEFYYKPEHGKFIAKLCPAPVSPAYLIKETGSTKKYQKDVHLTKHSYSLLSGWFISQTLGFWSAFRLFFSIFKPSMSPATATSLRHMDQFSRLTVENHDLSHREQHLQVGFTIEEMVNRAEGLLKSIGLIHHFADLVYIIGHGSSSVNNPHYAAYDCGACSGRPGSVNARVACYMANHATVRLLLKEKGIDIPEHTRFVAGLHDTTRDEMVFYDEETLNPKQQELHKQNKEVFEKALDENARERSRRFEVVDTGKSASVIHAEIKTRSVSLFEPRPELNHATNALCIIGRRALTKHLFLDRRAFMNSYDYRTDPEGKYLLGILKAAAPVCGGINLEYFFSRVDNQKLGAGTKLPHNVMGLIGVANGIDGDLRPGLPSQMIEVHDPVRLLIMVEHHPDVVLQVLKQSPETYEWFINEWILLVAIKPENREMYRFENGSFSKYHPEINNVPEVDHLMELIVSSSENIPVHLISQL